MKEQEERAPGMVYLVIDQRVGLLSSHVDDERLATRRAEVMEAVVVALPIVKDFRK